ncbi:hypothetical protein [Salibacterium halotolerans]|uniref:Uncharacterized protein n=1 Tax=Salibacterium halotolerans TaxID=1884432 RepID=A0A1I5QES2_9BACI|nr:hypothetical protein [Salibacterium halotolerans]SFP44561.1 hypothetical protein SAMN05518683_105124 [Salibacterium halotolerans]
MNRIHLDKKSAAWISKNGGAVCLYPFYPFSHHKERGPLDVMMSFENPSSETDYETITCHSGVVLYIHRDLEIKRQLRIRINGFGPFQHLSCTGIKHFKKKSGA